MTRYFRIHDDAVYEASRLALDAAFRYSPPVTCVDPAAVAPRDANGRILLAVRSQFCEFDVVAEMLPALLASGAVEELTEAEYAAACGVRSPPPGL